MIPGLNGRNDLMSDTGLPWLRRPLALLRMLERRTRPVDAKSRAAIRRRWAELPERVRTPGQTLGRIGVGCEGTHGVFPRCNFACKPCYHSADANRVRVDGPHTVANVEAQMAMLESERASFAHAQLIGGEVSLLEPDDHAAALLAMRRHGREPMSFTHGDFDYDYLRDVALDAAGEPRFDRLSFAGHFDTTMIGRRGLRRTSDEEELDPFRARFCAMFARLRREHGVRTYLAHNMTVTPANVGQISGVIRRCHGMGFGLFSFQPAAHVGDERRWDEDFRSLDADAVWAQIERGVGARLPYQLFEVGDTRCNRSVWGFYLGERWYSVLDENDPRDLAVRDATLRYFSGFALTGPLHLVTISIARLVARHPQIVPIAFGWAGRVVQRVGLVSLLRHRPRPVTFVMHRFMHAEDVVPAWEGLERGEMSDVPRIRETQERLQACSYAMAHPDTGRIVPACVQHSVLDPAENRQLLQLLPLSRSARRTATPHETDAAPGAGPHGAT